MKTFSLKTAQVNRKWYLLDASEAPLGRLSTQAARLLIGKGKPDFTPHIDGGDFVVIVNAAQLRVTGGKSDKKIYYRHSGYPGGLYQRTLSEMLERDPGTVIRRSVRGMLPVNKLRQGRLRRLKVYSGPEHQHTAQQPQKTDANRKASN